MSQGLRVFAIVLVGRYGGKRGALMKVANRRACYWTEIELLPPPQAY
jgi:hypothetical protein